ncbi:hypothetical protein NEUTE1DRAFT_104917 [Neurospora tetrasperma FGSC 2508]|uniref:Uncharacterized protein n=1 Tax=Neurospora tetrasperma (strain FGSC 2508 / ATCC MYA-4615 / P0657) TaxID=510951 RepID=F8N4R0_NEUT8|nr:uncharacterized protein NEUTE1DRAFT_104917 [Neurospora tetrasperma FGSC 2508]EGO51897.1 hypothetical protein NEUTE1DRAFT_104917 [Neurospora tetrasperma FGSC 2508]
MARTKYTPVPLSPISAVAVVLGGASEIEELQPQNLWDGISGVFTRPIAGAREEGTVGFLKGFGQGLGELVMKPTTGALEAPGFIFLGFYRELEKLGKADSEAQIVMGRLAQGEGEYVKLHKSERQRIVTAWRVCEGMAKRAADNAAKRAEANNRLRLWGSALARARHGTGTILEPLELLETLELTGAEMGMDSSMDCPCITAETGHRLG